VSSEGKDAKNVQRGGESSFAMQLLYRESILLGRGKKEGGGKKGLKSSRNGGKKKGKLIVLGTGEEVGDSSIKSDGGTKPVVLIEQSKGGGKGRGRKLMEKEEDFKQFYERSRRTPLQKGCDGHRSEKRGDPKQRRVR